MLGHLRDRRRIEQAGNLDLELHRFVNADQCLGGKQRVAAEREEIVMDADLVAPQDVGPYSGEYIFERRAWRNKGLRRVDAVRETQFHSKPDAPHFAGCAFGQFLEEQQLTRHLELGEPRHGELLRYFSLSPWRAAGHNGRGHVFSQSGVR